MDDREQYGHDFSNAADPNLRPFDVLSPWQISMSREGFELRYRIDKEWLIKFYLGPRPKIPAILLCRTSIVRRTALVNEPVNQKNRVRSPADSSLTSLSSPGQGLPRHHYAPVDQEETTFRSLLTVCSGAHAFRITERPPCRSSWAAQRVVYCTDCISRLTFSASANTRSVFSPRIFRMSVSEYPFFRRASVICGK